MDDDEIVLDAVENALNEYGLKIVTFKSGEDFMEYVNTVERVPDLILLDIMMPGTDGFEVVRKIRISEETLPECRLFF